MPSPRLYDYTDCSNLPLSGPGQYHANGLLKSCLPDGEIILKTPLGPLTPQHTADDLRRKTLAPITFHDNGMIRSLPLERPTLVATPAGPVPAELVTFHSNGAPHRVFPLNGKLSGFWSQEDEAALATPLRITTPLGSITATFISLRFNDQGDMLSLTLWPGQTLNVPTSLGQIVARIGVSFHPNGAVQSLEPESPVTVDTPLGPVQAYDPDAIGISGDSNSLAFDPSGRVERLTTVNTSIFVSRDNGLVTAISPSYRDSYCGNGEKEPVPMAIGFESDQVHFKLSPLEAPVSFPTQGSSFHTEPFRPLFAPAHHTLSRCAA